MQAQAKTVATNETFEIPPAYPKLVQAELFPHPLLKAFDKAEDGQLLLLPSRRSAPDVMQAELTHG